MSIQRVYLKQVSLFLAALSLFIIAQEGYDLNCKRCWRIIKITRRLIA